MIINAMFGGGRRKGRVRGRFRTCLACGRGEVMGRGGGVWRGAVAFQSPVRSGGAPEEAAEESRRSIDSTVRGLFRDGRERGSPSTTAFVGNSANCSYRLPCRSQDEPP